MIEQENGYGIDIFKCDTCGQKVTLPVPRPDTITCIKCKIKVKLV